MPSQSEIRQQITAKIISALENNILPWRRPWKTSKNTGRPANVVSKRAYSGINPMLWNWAAWNTASSPAGGQLSTSGVSLVVP